MTSISDLIPFKYGVSDLINFNKPSIINNGLNSLTWITFVAGLKTLSRGVGWSVVLQIHN